MSRAHSSASRRESQQHGVRTAEKLLREFYPHSDSGQTQMRLLQSLCLLATREKTNVEAALGAFIEMAQTEVWKARDGFRRAGVTVGATGRVPQCLLPRVRRGTASLRCWPWPRPTCC